MAESTGLAIVPDDSLQPDDDDSAVSVPISSLTSIRSSILRHQTENGRTYHSLSQGKYAYPNDEGENERLELQHYVWMLTFRNQLALCPKAQGAKRVLDVGTGTGIWAIDYADLNPESEVIGVDLSAIQPTMVPPNLLFEVDDLEKDWTWTKQFDFVFSRAMAGSFSDYQAYIQKAYDSLDPGGYLEMQDFSLPYRSDDGTLKEDMALHKLGNYFIDASKALGRRIDAAPEYKSMLEAAGFEDVVEKQFKWPINTWPKDKYYKELGQWTFANLDSGIEGLTLALFTRGLGWTVEATTVFCAELRKQFKDTSIHAYCPIYIVYGRKPGPK